MALSSTSTFLEAEAEYLDTLGYVEANSSALAFRHAISLGHMILKVPRTSAKGSNQISYDTDVWVEEKQRALDFAKANRVSAAGDIVRVDFRNMHGHG